MGRYLRNSLAVVRQVPKNGGIDFGRESTGIKIYPMGTYYVFVYGYLCWFNKRHFFVGIFFGGN